ncbi:Short-chain dehydrogenase/reductase SDR [Botryosphaeria dothidea]|uniref:Short-chain dehydrogenase/reductase SDR n=1 Tax=Botryosphaeria dothidea TaxID=55169 RepID=A0A8H4N987_9PEZI|nr:Short-chain dehydrogenase/reductase SDR [Botryosphaeria dothidea]
MDLDALARPLTKTTRRTQYPAIDPTNPANSAIGKTVVITGGTGGIGYLIARGFFKAGAGTIILLARRQEALDEGSANLRAEIAAAKGKTDVWTYLLDVGNAGPDPINVLFEDIRKRLNDEGKGKDVDILVTNAASVDQGKTALEFDPKVIQDSFNTNVIGHLNIVRAFLAPEIPAIPLTALGGQEKDTSRALIPKHEKVILDVSTGAIHVQLPGQAIYSTSKLSFTHLLTHLQTELDRLPGSPVRIISFNPGVILSPGARRIGLKEGDLPSDDDSLPEGFAVWLASPAAAFLKGRFVWSRWDVEELIALKPKFEEDPTFCQVVLSDWESSTSIEEPTVELIEEWLAPLPLNSQFQRTHNAAVSARHPDTETRFLDTPTFANWVDEPSINKTR